MTSLKPTHDFILINVTLPAGISIPDGSIPTTSELRVLAVGPDVKSCKPGDIVLLHPDTRNAIPMQTEPNPILLVRDSNLIAVQE